MKRMKNTPNFIKTLVKANGKGSGRKVWSVDLETVWLPFFTATNTMGDTRIPHEALGAPLRLTYNPDGSVKFSKAGRPVIKVAKDISDNVKLVRENFIAGLQNYASTVINENTEAYKEQVKLCTEAGAPLQAHDKDKLDEAMEKIVQQAIDEAETHEHSHSETESKEKELVTV
jgi:hypothetical protein